MRTLEERLALPVVKIDLGCGLSRHEKEFDEYIYIDGDKGDPREPIDIVCNWDNIPLPDKTADVLHSSDTIEHIEIWRATEVLKEWNRIMKIGCYFFGTTPNLDYVCRAYASGRQTLDWTLRNLFGDRAGFHHSHYTIHTVETLTKLLEDHGFGEIRFDVVGNSDPKEYWWLSFHCKKVKDI